MTPYLHAIEQGRHLLSQEAAIAPTVSKLMHPAKVRSALRRRWFEHRLERTPFAPCPGLVSLGSEYGCWVVPGDVIERSWTCYSVGAGGDITFDLELIRRYGVQVRSFDAVEGYVDDARRDAAGERRLSAHHAAIAAADGPIRMQVTHDPRSRSVSAAGLYESDSYVEVPGRRLQTLTHELGDERVELLKLDIEGSEYEVLPQIDLRALGVRVFLAQFHHIGGVRGARGLIGELDAQGFRPVACIPAVKMTFLRD